MLFQRSQDFAEELCDQRRAASCSSCRCKPLGAARQPSQMPIESSMQGRRRAPSGAVGEGRMRLRGGWNTLRCPSFARLAASPQNPLTDDSRGPMTGSGWGRTPPVPRRLHRSSAKATSTQVPLVGNLRLTKDQRGLTSSDISFSASHTAALAKPKVAASSTTLQLSAKANSTSSGAFFA